MSSTTTSFITAAAAAIMLTLPMVGSAEAGLNGFANSQRAQTAGNHTLHLAKAGRGFRQRGRLATPVIDQRIARQSRRIARGRATGRLTRIETIRLRGRLFAIRSARKFARIDGRVSMRERTRLLSMLDANSKRIRRLSRNGRRS